MIKPKSKLLYYLLGLVVSSLVYVAHYSSQTRWEGLLQPTSKIPNLVHFIFIQTNTTTSLTLHDFIAIYSAHYHLKSPEILLHVTEPLSEPYSPYTEAILKIPNLKVNPVKLINQTKYGTAIVKLPHQSDFLRAELLAEYGGVYCDLDVVILRDFAPLRNSGFEVVVGMQVDKSIASGMFLTIPKGALMHEFREQMHELYNPKVWADHVVGNLGNLSRKYANTTLILPHDALSPLDWSRSQLERLLFDRTTDFFDWRTSYSLHAYRSAIGWNGVLPFYNNMTVVKLLLRNSNYARAIYPALKSAVENGYLTV